MNAESPAGGDLETLIRAVDALEDRGGYVSLAEVERAMGREVAAEIASAVLLVDYRQRADGTRVTLCRLNRHHPTVQRLTAW